LTTLDDLGVMLADLREKEVAHTITDLLQQGFQPTTILEACKKGMELVGRRYQAGEYFLADMLFAAEIFDQIMKIMRPKLEGDRRMKLGLFVIGTVQGDIHDIGKNIVRTFLEAAGFEVHDMGVDIPPDKFLESLKTIRPQIGGLSCLLTMGFESMKKTIDAINGAGLRNSVKIIIGGAPVTETVMNYVGADAYTTSAVEGVEICSRWALPE
jgi:dimethylamine corrinoid protein